jgi:hypothetical protein
MCKWGSAAASRENECRRGAQPRAQALGEKRCGSGDHAGPTHQGQLAYLQRYIARSCTPKTAEWGARDDGNAHSLMTAGGFQGQRRTSEGQRARSPCGTGSAIVHGERAALRLPLFALSDRTIRAPLEVLVCAARPSPLSGALFRPAQSPPRARDNLPWIKPRTQPRGGAAGTSRHLCLLAIDCLNGRVQMSRLGRRIPDQARVAPRRVGDRRGAPCSAAERELIAK